MKVLAPLLLLVVAALLSSCASLPDREDDRDRYDGPPRVVIHPHSVHERRYSSLASDYFEQAGYIVSNGGRGEYELEFTLDDGPINAVVNMTLIKRGRTLAEVEGKAGGPRMLFDREGIIREAFEDAFRQLDSDLPRQR